jgi:thiamine pyrophosphate-dependent acetolactate synthase large subunit-like protein
MDVSNIKNRLHELIESTEDEELLTQVYIELNDINEKQDWWSALNDKEKQRILESGQQYERSEITSNEVVLKKIQQWLGK